MNVSETRGKPMSTYPTDLGRGAIAPVRHGQAHVCDKYVKARV